MTINSTSEQQGQEYGALRAKLKVMIFGICLDHILAVHKSCFLEKRE